jgi:precorrin-6B methylase 2
MARSITPGKLLGLAQSFMESRILQSGAELNVFTILDETALTAPEIAARLEADPQPLSVLLDALSAMGLLSKKGERYKCDRPVSRLLSEKSPVSILPMIRHMGSLWVRWARLPEIVKGAPEAKQEFHFWRSPEELRAFIGAMHVAAGPMAKRIAAEVQPGHHRALLDVGGGSGTYTIAFLRAVPEMKATLFDLPEVVEMARERLEKEGLLDRATLVAGSFYDSELPGGHDLALLSAIIHSNSLEQNLELYRKIYRALNPGGRILIRDHIMESDRIHPRDGAIFAINMLVGTQGGSCYTFDEINEGLIQAGFIRVNLLCQGEHMDGVVEAFKA